MTFARSLASTTLLLATLVSCADSVAPDGAPERITSLPRALTSSETAVIDASNTFAFWLLRELNRTRADANIFMSPLSASMALGMTMNGTAGTTLDEMRAALGFGNLELPQINESYRGLIALLRALDRRVDFRIANSIWYREGFPVEPAFLAATRDHFDARVAALDFGSSSAPATINGWVDESTAGRIDRIVDDALDPRTVMFLINAIYFKGDWTRRFDPARTRDDVFTTLDGSTVPVRMMSGSIPVRGGGSSDAEVIELPYGGGVFAMTIVLPRPGRTVNDLIATLSVAEWARLIGQLTDRELPLMLPRFTLRWKGELNEELKSLGMLAAFGGGDFTPMSAPFGRDLFISRVLQKSFVDVNEAGTEAAAATSVEVGVTSAPAVTRVDRPFLFAIRERLSGTVLFVGKIVAP